MNKNWFGVIGVILVVIVLVWLLASKVSCHKSFWDKDTQVIEITK